MMPIKTSFGQIREWTPRDADALVKYGNNRKIWLNMRDIFPSPYTEARAIAFLEMVERQDPTTSFAIATDTEAIGGIGVSINKDVHRFTAELGYWLGEPHWGKGVMTEAVSKFTECAFDCFNLRRIYAEAYATNASSCRVLEKAGFEFEGRLRSSAVKDGQILDQLLYSRIKPVKSS
jgi:RimJ/RimL family protein N-acetyltransferase